MCLFEYSVRVSTVKKTFQTYSFSYFVCNAMQGMETLGWGEEGGGYLPDTGIPLHPASILLEFLNKKSYKNK